MENKLSFDDIIVEIQRSDTKEQIEYYCSAFCQHTGFDHYLAFGSIFTSLLSPPTCVIGNLGKSVRNKKRRLDSITHTCMNSSTPIITGNFDKHSILYNSLIKTQKAPSTKGVSISFPVHFPMGKFAFLHIYINAKQADSEEKILATLAQGYMFAKEMGTSILHLLEYELDNQPPYLNTREKECLLLASDGATPQKIAEQVGLSSHTVIFHLKKARDKLKTKNIQGAVGKAMLRGDIAIRIGSEKA